MTSARCSRSSAAAGAKSSKAQSRPRTATTGTFRISGGHPECPGMPIFTSVASDTHREEGMKDQKKIRLGLIGVGNWALFAHVRVLRLLPEYEIVAIYSQRKEAAMAAATEYGIPHVAESLDALVTDPLVDQVLVLTTSQQHEKGIRAAINAGKNVYCEWPLTPTAAKSAELAALADAAGVKTQIGL